MTQRGAEHRCGWWIVTLVLLAPAPAVAREPVVAVENTGSGCNVRGTFQAPVSGAVAWAVLTDYDHIGEFVRSVRSSRVERREGGKILLRQTALGSVFLFRRRVEVLLELHEIPGRRIAFHDVLGKDFQSYVGEWRVAADSVGSRVEYDLAAEPRALPRSFCRGALRKMARDLLEQVRAEMLRRGAGPRL